MFPAALPPNTVATICVSESSQHTLDIHDPASTAPHHYATTLNPGDCYTGGNITLRVPAHYRVDAHAPTGSAWTGNVTKSKHRKPGSYHLANHRHGDTILVRIY